MSKITKLISLILIVTCVGCVPASKLERFDERLTQLESQNFSAYQHLIEQYQQLLENSQALVEKNQQLRSENQRLSKQIQSLQNRGVARWPFITIAVGDSLRISRTLEPEGLSPVNWVILFDGEEVLQRNALNETQYTYHGQTPGVYTIYVAAFIDRAYRVISNIISYKIE
jgi:hypothetical protein